MASQRYPDRPLRFGWDGRNHEVVEVIAESRTPRVFSFTILDDEQNKFLLSYNESTQVWTVKPWK